MAGSGEGPLERWSRRKTEAHGERENQPRPDEAAAFAELADTPHADPVADEAETVDAETPPLPPLEELDADSDYTPFLAEGVPEALARAALRKLWLSDPVFANLDGLNDYDEDFNLIDKVIAVADANDTSARGRSGGEETEDGPALTEEADEDALADADESIDQDVEDEQEGDVADIPDNDESNVDGGEA